MIRWQFRSKIIHERSSHCLCPTLVFCAFMALAVNSASAQLAPNQTNGFGNNRLVTFTYLQNFDCVDQPTLDLDFNGKKAESDPKCRRRFVRRSPNLQPIPRAATSSTQPISTSFFP